MTQYFVTGNLRHDGRRFKRGDAIELTEEQARPLAHVLSKEAVSASETPADIEIPASTPTPGVTVGGTPYNTGEPSIDGSANADTRTDAKDVTPVILSKAQNRQTLEKAAGAQGLTAEEIASAPTKAELIELIKSKQAAVPATPVQPVQPDPSANL
jgi:hypothetical protein